MRTRLWTRWDTVTVVGYEALALPIAFFVHGDRQLPTFIVGLLVIVVVARPLLDRTDRGERLRASIPRGTRAAPLWLSILAAVVIMVAISLVLRGLGAGDSVGWLLVATGGVNPSISITNRWWTARATAA